MYASTVRSVGMRNAYGRNMHLVKLKSEGVELNNLI